MTDVNWSLVTVAKESGGRITPSRLERVLGGRSLEDQLAAFSRRGYHFALTSRGSLELEKSPTRLFAEEIAHDLGTGVVGRRIEVHWTVESTQDLARREAERGREGAAIFAEEQSRGKGRFGRKWTAPKYSSLLFSMALHSPPGQVGPEALALGGAVAVAEALEDTYSLSAHIRWPNDVLIDGRKVAGVLVASISRGVEGKWFVVGIGVNVNVAPDDFSADLKKTAASVSDFTGGVADRAFVARAVLRRLDFWWEVLKAGERERLSRSWRKRSDILGTFVTVRSKGKNTSGRVVDLDHDFGLVLQLRGGPTRVFAPAETAILG